MRGEKKSIPIPKGTMLKIHVPGLHYNRTYRLISDLYIYEDTFLFQLVTGTTRINSTLRVSSKIGLVMLFCHLVLVYVLSPSLENLPKKIYILQEPVHA